MAANLLHVVVGITGHRNPPQSEWQRMRDEFLQILSAVQALAPSTPITLLSALAAGCDQLAAEWALEWGEERPLCCGSSRVRLIVPRPIPRHDYLCDFDRAEERERFETLEARAWLGFDLPLGEPEPRRDLDRDANGRIINRDGRRDRDEHYRRLGRFVAQQSHLVVAFWDGGASGGIGGTAEIVHFCRSGGSLAELRHGQFRTAPFRQQCPWLSQGDPTPVIVVPTPRQGAGSGILVRPDSMGIADADLSCLKDIECLNNAVAANSSGIERPCPMRNSPLGGEPGFEAACGLFKSMDQVATQAKRRFLSCSKWLVVMVCLAVALFQLFSSFSAQPLGRVGLVSYVVLLLAAVGLRSRIQRARTEWTFVHARSITEILRVQIAMTLAGWREEVGDWSLARREMDVRPLRRLLRGSTIGLLALPLLEESEAGIVSAKDGWLRDQQDYWAGQMQPGAVRVRTANALRWCGWLAEKLVLSTAVVLTGLMFTLVLLNWSPSTANGFEIFNACGCLVVGVSLAFSLGVEAWRQASLDEEDLHQFRRMQEVFSTALSRLQDEVAHPDATRRRQDILRAAGREQFDEVCDWHVRHCDRLP